MNITPDELLRTQANMTKAKEIAADLHDHPTASAQVILEMAVCLILLRDPRIGGNIDHAMVYLNESRMISPMIMIASKLELDAGQ